SWDVAVALDPASRVAPGAVDLIVDTLGPLAARSGKPDGTKLRLHVSASGPQRDFTLESGETVTLAPSAAGEDAGLPELQLPAEALVRLVYGRLDPAHTPPVETRGVDLDELRRLFPGF
ncbi:MAG TPA: maleylpyruvate isomerase family mycothiol-dependent enzyme, partial [Streptosporangiaceae bacterium]|nr:maleylpyruvate isomerase family mycothiol-dependent enzyme [Streptosporangiaceae bacterium]